MNKYTTAELKTSLCNHERLIIERSDIDPAFLPDRWCDFTTEDLHVLARIKVDVLGAYQRAHDIDCAITREWTTYMQHGIGPRDAAADLVGERYEDRRLPCLLRKQAA